MGKESYNHFVPFKSRTGWLGGFLKTNNSCQIISRFTVSESGRTFCTYNALYCRAWDIVYGSAFSFAFCLCHCLVSVTTCNEIKALVAVLMTILMFVLSAWNCIYRIEWCMSWNALLDDFGGGLCTKFRFIYAQFLVHIHYTIFTNIFPRINENCQMVAYST